MKVTEMMDDLVKSRLIERPQEDASPSRDPDNYIYVPTVTFYKMPEPPPLSLPFSEAENTSDEEDASGDA